MNFNIILSSLHKRPFNILLFILKLTVSKNSGDLAKLLKMAQICESLFTTSGCLK